jgi:hypothetical protein
LIELQTVKVAQRGTLIPNNCFAGALLILLGFLLCYIYCAWAAVKLDIADTHTMKILFGPLMIWGQKELGRGLLY